MFAPFLRIKSMESSQQEANSTKRTNFLKVIHFCYFVVDVEKA
jgi:hypothetical protein